MSRKPYKHVESKVTRYIKEIKEQDEAARVHRLEAKPQRKRQVRHVSNPDGDSIDIEERDPNCLKEKSNYNELFQKYQAALQEITHLRSENLLLAKTVQESNRTGITDVKQITFVSDSEVEHTCNSTICSEDFGPLQQSRVSISRSIGVNYEVPLILNPDGTDFYSAFYKYGDGRHRSFMATCRTTTKKLLRKFSCGKEEQQTVDNIAGTEFHHMQRVHTPRVQHDFEKGVSNMSTPDGRKTVTRRTISSARRTPKRVAFLGDNVSDDRSTRARRLMANLNEVGEFLSTL